MTEHDRIIDAAMGLFAERGWRGVSLADIAAAADLSLADLYGRFPSKLAVVEAFLARIDAAMLAGGSAPDASVRDRLFDVLMRRFEALKPHRLALRALLRDLRGDPLAALCLSRAYARSMAWALEAAGLDSHGLRGALRVKGLGATHLATLRVFLDDDGEDLGRTMAALDRHLKRLESIVRSFPGRRRAETAAA